MNKFEEGEQVLVKAVIARPNDEMSVLDMTTNKGEPYTMVVRTSDVTRPTDDKVARIRAEIEKLPRHSTWYEMMSAINRASAVLIKDVLKIIDKEGAGE